MTEEATWWECESRSHWWASPSLETPLLDAKGRIISRRYVRPKERVYVEAGSLAGLGPVLKPLHPVVSPPGGEAAEVEPAKVVEEACGPELGNLIKQAYGPTAEQARVAAELFFSPLGEAAEVEPVKVVEEDLKPDLSPPSDGSAEVESEQLGEEATKPDDAQPADPAPDPAPVSPPGGETVEVEPAKKVRKPRKRKAQEG